MATRYLHTKQYGPFKGLNKGVSDLLLKGDYQSLAQNAFINSGSTALTSRVGRKPVGWDPASTDKKVFAGLYIETDVTTEQQYERELILNIDDGTFEVIKDFTITISNVGAVQARAEVNFNELTSSWRFQLLNDSTNAVLYTLDLDSAGGVPSVTVSTLVAGINALADFNCTLGTAGAGASFASVAFDAQVVELPVGADRAVKGLYLDVKSFTTPVIQTYAPYYSNGQIQNGALSYTNLQNILYVAVPGVGLCKWDGVDFYKAGFPAPKINPDIGNPFSATVGAGGANPRAAPGYYSYAFAYEKKDAKGNRYESLGRGPNQFVGGTVESNSNAIAAAGTYIAVQGLNNSDPLLGYGPQITPYNVRSAVVKPNFSILGGTVEVFSSTNTMRVGDIACFKIRLNRNPTEINWTQDGSEFSILLCEAEITNIQLNTPSVGTDTITLNQTGWTITHLYRNRTAYKTAVRGWATSQNWTTASPFDEESDVSLADIIAYATFFAPGTLDTIPNTTMSNNVRVNAYRTKGEGLVSAPTVFPSDWYLLDIEPARTDPSLIQIWDWYADRALGPLWEQKIEITSTPFPDFEQILDTKYTICHSHQQRMYLSGEPKKPNVVDRSDPLWGPEFYYPGGDLQLNMETTVASTVTAISSAGPNVIVGKSRGIRMISGDLGTADNIRVDDISFELGIQNQASTLFGINSCIALSQLGPIEILPSGSYNFVGSRDLSNKSRLEGIIKNGNFDLNFASASLNPDKGYYFLYLPYKGSGGTTAAANESFLQFNQGADFKSQTQLGEAYIYLTTQDSWFKWVGLEATGGSYTKQGLLHTVSTGNLGSIILRELSSETLSDYVDWYQGINWDVATNWEHLGEPYQYKSFIRAYAQNIETDPLAGGQFTILIEAERDWVADTAYSSYSLSDLGAIGKGLFKVSGNKSRSMRFRMKHSAVKKRPMVTGLTVEVAAEFKPMVKQG